MLCGEDTWRAALKKYFGPSSCRKWCQLAVDVQCVALGLKPAYLLDVLQPDPVLFCSLLNDVLPDSIISQQRRTEWWNKLCVVSVDSDVLLVNRTAIQDLFQSPQQPAYVDISKSESPKASADCTDVFCVVKCSSEIEKKCQIWYSELLAAQHVEGGSMPPGKDGILTFLSAVLPPDLNMCTVFGRLLGYPVVYWFHPASHYTLDMVELVNYHVTVSSTSHCCLCQTFHVIKDHCLYSFSVPCCVEAATRDSVWVWFQGLKEKALALGLKLNLTDTVVSLPSVIL